jgi:hypothetical protein
MSRFSATTVWINPVKAKMPTVMRRRGYEMLGYRIEQGYADLEASMQWVKTNTEFQADQVVLISFSMAALDARRLHPPSARQEPTIGSASWESVRLKVPEEHIRRP